MADLRVFIDNYHFLDELLFLGAKHGFSTFSSFHFPHDQCPLVFFNLSVYHLGNLKKTTVAHILSYLSLDLLIFLISLPGDSDIKF